MSKLDLTPFEGLFLRTSQKGMKPYPAYSHGRKASNQVEDAEKKSERKQEGPGLTIVHRRVCSSCSTEATVYTLYNAKSCVN